MGVKANGSAYDSLWDEVEKQEQEGRLRSALAAVEPILSKAQEENNVPQRIKALFHKYKYRMTFEEESEISIFTELEDELKTAGFPEKPLLASVLAELYWQYYGLNRYKFLNRTEVAGEAVTSDPSAWDLRTFIKKISGLYLSSLEEADKLSQIPVSAFAAILFAGNSQEERPTLYDFLAHRALDFFMNEEVYLTQPAHSFQLEDSRLFGEAAEFVRLKPVVSDPSSLKYQALLILQQLTRLRLADKHTPALVDVELKRLQFIRTNAVGLDTATLYLAALDSLASRYRSTPLWARISYERAYSYYEEGVKTVQEPVVPAVPAVQSGETQAYLKRAFELCAEILARFPADEARGTPAEKDVANARALQSRILEKRLELNLETVNVPGEPVRALVKYRNLTRVFLRICRLDETQRQELDNRSLGYGADSEDDFFLKLSPLHTLSFTLPDPGDYRTHAVEIKLPSLEKGAYLLLASEREDFAREENAYAYLQFWSSRIGYIQRTDKEHKNEFYFSDRQTGAPLARLKATQYTRTWDSRSDRYVLKTGETFTADGQGYLKIDKSGENNFQLELKTGDDRLFLNREFYHYEDRTARSDGTLPQRVISYFFTDRAIYRPGQTIHFKGLVVESGALEPGAPEKTRGFNARIKPHYRTKVVFRDVNWEQIGALDLVTNEYGTFSGSFTAPQNRLNGEMQIQNESGRVSFSVEEYKRPKFEVNFKPLTTAYRLGESVKVTGEARAYAGAVLDEAEVRYRVVRRAIFPYWHWWWGYPPASPETIIKQGLLKTNTQGEFVIEFKALPDPAIDQKEQPVFDYDIYADVTDITGETHSNRTSVSLGYVALILAAEVPEQIERENPAAFTLSSKNLNGQFEPAKGQVVIHKLLDPKRSYRQRLWPQPDLFLYSKDEFCQAFPHDAYADEDNRATWVKERKVLEKSFDTRSTTELRLDEKANWEQGSYVLELLTRDKYGAAVSVVKYFTLFSLQTASMPVKADHWFVPLEVSGEPGETARLLVGSSAADVNGFYEIIRGLEVLERQPVRLNNEKKLIEIPIKEEYRGNFTVNIHWNKFNRSYTVSQLINVGWSNKELKLEFETFRDKLEPGAQEEWRIKLSGRQSGKVAAEMVATLYDASLEVFRPHNWYLSLYPAWGPSLSWSSAGAFLLTGSRLNDYNWNELSSFYERTYDRLNYFDFSLYQFGYWGGRDKRRSRPDTGAEMLMDGGVAEAQPELEAPVPAPSLSQADGKGGNESQEKEKKSKTFQGGEGERPEAEIKARTNLQETAFFFPHLQTDDKGRFILSFTMPEALTRWRLLALAHTKELEIANISKELVTQKSLMVTPHVPRFLRQGDRMVLTAKVSNLTAGELSGEARLALFDALTMQPLDLNFGLKQPAVTFNAQAGQSAALSWEIVVPETAQAVTCRVLARAGNFSDGEETTLPVLTNRQLVTEAQPLTLREAGEKTFHFEKLLESGASPTLKQHRLTLEFTTNPAWYAVQALPYLMEFPYECTEQIFSRYYANSLAAFIANSQPRLKKVFDAWKHTPSSQALLSHLEKNQELKALLLEETPWVLEARDENERKQRLGLLFDLNHMAQAQEQAFHKLQQTQSSAGGWPWFPGLPEDRYITQHIVAGLGHLARLGVYQQAEAGKGSSAAVAAELRTALLRKAVGYLDTRMQADYERLIARKADLQENHLTYFIIHSLYARSFFTDWQPEKGHQTAYGYWLKQVKTYWLDSSLYMKGLSALILYRNQLAETARQILISLKEAAVYTDELGMYWKELTNAGFYWYQAPVETQALLIEAFNEIAADTKTVDELRLWLIKQKQTTDWRTTKATAEACYALLLSGTDWLTADNRLAITLGGKPLDLTSRETATEAGTGYFKKSWYGGEITPAQGEVTISKVQPGPAWGALYWQYFEELDKITHHATPLQLVKQVYLQKETGSGFVLEPITANTRLKPGALLKVRLELRADRDMEYIHLKDMRAAGLEPVNVISRYKYQDGLWYYESTKDAVTHFFIPWLAKGTYVFEYPLRVSHSGDFSNGIASIQSMYAPEFGAHSAGLRIRID